LYRPTGSLEHDGLVGTIGISAFALGRGLGKSYDLGLKIYA